MSDMLADHFEKSLFKTTCNTHLLHTHHIGIACSKYIMWNNQIWSPWSEVQVVLKNVKKSSVKKDWNNKRASKSCVIWLLPS